MTKQHDVRKLFADKAVIRKERRSSMRILVYWLLGFMAVILPVMTAGPVRGSEIVYSYDSAGRLESADAGNNVISTYTYDANGNMLSRMVKTDAAPPGPSPAINQESGGARGYCFIDALP
ncbi:MAG: RHS repeat domain-containing protein [Pseudomonadota bacterium]